MAEQLSIWTGLLHRVALSAAALVIAIIVFAAPASGRIHSPPPSPESQTPPNEAPPPNSQPEPRDVDVDDDKSPEPDPTVGLLTPIPEQGNLPPIYSKLNAPSEEELARRAAVREYRQQIRQIRSKHFGDRRAGSPLRQQGLQLLREFIDPAAFRPMHEELAREKDDVRLAVLDHFKSQGDEGQAALAWTAMMDKDAAIRHEASKRLITPPPAPVLRVLDFALRSDDPHIANAAAGVAGMLNVIEAIPLMIFAQASPRPPAGEERGDIAWIAIQTQRAFVAGLVPIVGNGSGGFQPIIGVVSEGVVVRIMDAYVIEYRTEIHRTLVNMTTREWGQSTEPMSYNARAWMDWYNNEFVPLKNQQARERELAGPPSTP